MLTQRQDESNRRTRLERHWMLRNEISNSRVQPLAKKMTNWTQHHGYGNKRKDRRILIKREDWRRKWLPGSGRVVHSIQARILPASKSVMSSTNFSLVTSRYSH